jgi:hypothetical protein
MSLLTIVLINIAAAGILSAILAAVMLAPMRLRESFDRTATHYIRAVRHAEERAIAAARHERPRAEHRVLEPVE